MLKKVWRSASKVYPSSESALSDIPNGSTILIGGFGVCGVPENLLRGLHKHRPTSLTIYTNLSGTNTYGPGLLVGAHMVSHFHASYIGANEELERQYLSGEIELELIPQGSLIERFRAGSFGISSFYTPTGAGSLVEHGGFPMKYSAGGKSVEKYSQPKPSRLSNGVTYLLEKAIVGDFALIKAWKADTQGNLIYKKTARNSNADIAGAATVTIAEVEEIVPAGSLDPDHIHTPGVLVNRVVCGERYDKPIGSLTLNTGAELQIPGTPEQIRKKMVITRRAAREIKEGMFVNLGIGMPTLIPNFIPKGMEICLHGENGVMGIGPYPSPGNEDPDLTNAGKETITMMPGASTFSSSTSFGIIRGNHLDLTVLGGLQVSEGGDLANWVVPGKMVKGMGGAMDLVSSSTRCIVCMEHMAKDAKRVVQRCELPLTGKKIVSMLITDLGVFEFNSDVGMSIVEIADRVTIDEIKSKTGARFHVDSGLKTMEC